MKNMPELHRVVRAGCEQSLQKLYATIVESISSTTGSEAKDLNLSTLHTLVEKEEINNIRLGAFQAINAIGWKSLVKAIAFSEVAKLLGPDLCIQKKINLSIQMPSDDTSLLASHSDSSSGESPFQYNIWIPLTKAYSTNSMFLIDKSRSISYYSDMINNEASNITPRDEDFINADFGEFLLFPPSLIHGNIYNTTESTRVSLNVRVKSLFAPDLPDAPPDRKYGIFYETWHESDAFKWNSMIYKKLSK